MFAFNRSQTKRVRDSDIFFVVNSKSKDFSSQLNSKNNNGISTTLTSSEQDEKRLKQSHSSLLRVFFLFAFYSCISPFRISRDADGRNVAKRWMGQMVACCLLCCDCCSLICTSDGRAEVISEIFHAIRSLGLTLNAWFSLWRKSDRFVDVVEYVDSTKALPHLPSKISYGILAAIACFAYTCLGLTSAFLGSELMPSSVWTPSSWVRCLMLEGRYQFFIGPESEKCNGTLLNQLEVTPVDHFLAGVTGFGQFFKYITSFYWELLILFGVLSLWLPSAQFANHLKEDTENDDDDDDDDDDTGKRSDERILQAAAQWPMLEEQYLSLKDLSDLVNNAFGAMVFSYTFTSIFYYSINLDAFLLTTDILVRIRLVVLYLGAVVLYILAADVCRQVGHLEIWLSEFADDEAKSNVPFHRLTVILNELSTSTIGITGWNVFTITYSVVANMTSVLITYFIICVQFRSGPTGS